MMRVLFLPEVVDQFLNLSEILYNKGYLNYKDTAIAYSEQLSGILSKIFPSK